MNAERVLNALCRHGLHLRPEQLSKPDRIAQLTIIEGMLKHETPSDLIQAIQYGMPEVWPFSNGGAYDASDVRKHLLKAKGEAQQKARAGEIPMTIRVQEGTGE